MTFSFSLAAQMAPVIKLCIYVNFTIPNLMRFHSFTKYLSSLSQINFTLVAGNMEDVFKIKTVNHTYGEVYVNAPLDRESVDRYLLKVR